MLKKEEGQTFRRKIFNKRILVFLILVLLTKGIIIASGKGLISTSPFVIRVLDLFLITSVSLLIANVFLRLTVGRVLDLFDGETEIEQRLFLSKMYSFFIYVMAFAVILSHIGLSVENITLFLGLVATGMALAIKDILTSIFSWTILLSKKPFRIRDVIKIGDESGEVLRVGTFYVTLKALEDDGEVIKIPSKTFLEKSIFNYGKGKSVKELKIPLEKTISSIRMKTIEDHIQSTYPLDHVNLSSDVEKGQLNVVVKLQGQAWEIRRITSGVLDILFKECPELIRKEVK